MTDRNTNQTQFVYDAQGRLQKIVDPVGLETVFAYNQWDRDPAMNIGPDDVGIGKTVEADFHVVHGIGTRIQNSIKLVREMPLTATGKILKKQLVS